MDIKKNRYASILDLNNYFKIKDLLGGLTLSQQETLRKNIGVDLDSIIDIIQDKIILELVVDDELSITSENAVQNKVITKEITDLKALLVALDQLNKEQESNIQKALSNSTNALEKSEEAKQLATEALEDSEEAIEMSNSTSTKVETLEDQIEALDDRIDNIQVSGGVSWVEVN